MRRFFVLIRREQIDPMTNAASDIMHEMCCFMSHNDHEEVLSSFEIEIAVRFSSGPDAGLADHVRAQRQAARQEARKRGQKSTGASGFGPQKRTIFSALSDLFPIRLSTDEIEVRVRAFFVSFLCTLIRLRPC